MPTIAALTSFTTATTALAAEVNSNFSTIRTAVNTYCLFTDAIATVTSVHTYSAKPVFNAGITVANPLTLSGAASTIVPGATSLSLRNNADSADNLILTNAGAATFRSTVGGITTLSCTTVTATNLGGTLSTAAQASVTSLGALTALTVAGNLTFSGASRKIIPGTTGLSVANVGDTFTAISVTADNVGLCVSALADVTVGSVIGTTNTLGFLQVPSCAGPPTGAAVDRSVVLDTTNGRIYFRYGSAWHYAALT